MGASDYAECSKCGDHVPIAALRGGVCVACRFPAPAMTAPSAAMQAAREIRALLGLSGSHDSEVAATIARHCSAPADAGGWRPIDDTAKNGERWLLGRFVEREHPDHRVAFWDGSDPAFPWAIVDGPEFPDGWATHYRALDVPPSPPPERRA